ncbi:hypothetical protein [Streptomyces longispororuber]|uniref:hypothetical protein n=1 Tax=Streptomyces longispororuber TaxID=68230 RepID=UPI0036FEDAAB
MAQRTGRGPSVVDRTTAQQVNASWPHEGKPPTHRTPCPVRDGRTTLPRACGSGPKSPGRPGSVTDPAA